MERELIVANIEDDALLGLDILMKGPGGPADIKLTKGERVLNGTTIPCIQLGQREVVRKMSTRPAKRGVVYICKKCPIRETAFEGEMYHFKAHMWKYHIPMDLIPYYCTLCLFRPNTRRSELESVGIFLGDETCFHMYSHILILKDSDVRNHGQCVSNKQPFHSSQI